MNSDRPTIAPLLVDERVAAKLLNISPRSLFTLERNGVVKAIRLGHAKRYSVEALREMIAEQVQGAEVAR